MKSKNILKSACSALACAMIGLVLHQPSALAASPTPAQIVVRNVLGAYEVNKSVSELAALAGGEDALVEALIAERDNRQTPFVGVRSEEMLLHFAGRSDVLAVLSDDLSSPAEFVFAEVIATHLDRVPDAGARQKLAQLTLQRASSDASFVPYARMLTFSRDQQLQKLGRQLPQVVQ